LSSKDKRGRDGYVVITPEWDTYAQQAGDFDIDASL